MPAGLDLRRVRAHLDRHGLVAGPLRAEVLAGGRSNLTYLVTDGTSRWVVRRPPLGHVLPTAHDMAREYRVLSALWPTPVPVPRTVLLGTDEGVPFSVMEHVDGTAYRAASDLAPLGPARTRALILSLVDTLVALHSVDPVAVGLGDFGRPDGYLTRQLARWSRQLDASRSRDVADTDELRARLGVAVPTSPAPTILHGDYRLDNVLVAGGAIRAILDWEMSTLGDPLTDLALLVVYAGMDAEGGSVGSAPGYPGADEIVARYTAASGRGASTMDWYVGFAYFKLAVIAEGIHYRFRQGHMVGTGFERAGELASTFAALGVDRVGRRGVPWAV